MEKQKVIEYFDQCAPTWDTICVPRPEVVEQILDNAKIQEGMRILDVACGTGVLFPYYLNRNAASITGVDISPKMVQCAREKFASCSRITLLCADVEELSFAEGFDFIMVHNAFPHFPDGKRLLRTLASFTNAHGRLTIAHSISRETINSRHEAQAQEVSVGLISAEELAGLFPADFDVDVILSNDVLYEVSGRKR